MPLFAQQSPAKRNERRTGRLTPKIDAWTHVFPKPYLDRVLAMPPGPQSQVLELLMSVPALSDMDLRFRAMDGFGDYRQVITPVPNLHLPLVPGNPSLATELVRISNDEMAAIGDKHRDRFRGFAATLPMHDPQEALKELDRVIGLGALGVQIEASVNGEALDAPRHEAFFARMAALGRPIWIHPVRTPLWPDYPGEKTSRYALWQALGWPYETSVCLARLVFAGHLQRHPNLKIIAHHGGAMIPHFSDRLGRQLEFWGQRFDAELGAVVQSLGKPLLDYFRMFYVDTALNGAKHAVACVVEFFGAGHVLFGTDTPFDQEQGQGFIRDTIADIEALGLDETARTQIYRDNATRLLNLPQA